MTQRDLITGGYTPSEQHLVITASSYSASMGGGVVVYCHGAGSNLPITAPDSRTDLDILADLGYVVVCPTSNGLTHWANDGAIASIDSMLTYIDAHPIYNANVTRPLFIADSMGAALAINWAVRNPTRIGKAVLRVPGFSLQTIHDTNVGSLAAGMETAYGGSGPLAAAYSTHDANHATFRALFNSLALASKFRIMYNAADPIINPVDVLAFCTATSITPIEMGGPSHAPWGYFDIAAQIKWLTT